MGLTIWVTIRPLQLLQLLLQLLQPHLQLLLQIILSPSYFSIVITANNYH